jgi:hypothetical protein
MYMRKNFYILLVKEIDMQIPFYLLLSTLVSSVFVFCGDADKANAASHAMPDIKEDSIVQPTGMIAYNRNDEEIRLIDSAGKNDKRLWTHPDAKAPFGIFDLAWRPDGKELAFSSGHENMLSLYHADLYAIRPDGSGLRRITNTPDYNSFGKYKKGTVTITLKNLQYSFQTAQSSTGIFTVYVIGAEMPQQVLLPPGTAKTIVFKNVADFGNHAQPVVAIYGQIRWVMPGLDVQAGNNTKAPDFAISGNGYEYYGAFKPVWKSDGTQISYRDGNCVVKTISSRPGIGVQFNPLFGEKGPSGSCYWDWGTTPALANQVLHQVSGDEETAGFYVRQEGETTKPPVPLYLTPEAAYDLKWLPDGSGFLYSKNYYRQSDYKRVANIFRYDIASKKHSQVTDLNDGYARQFSVSPSGKWIVYEKCQIDEEKPETLNFTKCDLWIISTNGTGDRLLVKNGTCPAWSR